MSFESEFTKFIAYCTEAKIELVEYNDATIKDMMYHFNRYDRGGIMLKDFKRELFKLDPNKRYKG